MVASRWVHFVVSGVEHMVVENEIAFEHVAVLVGGVVVRRVLRPRFHPHKLCDVAGSGSKNNRRTSTPSKGVACHSVSDARIRTEPG